MTEAPLEYRILTALLLGSATSAELSLMLGVDRSHAQKRVQWLKSQHFVREHGWGDVLKGRQGFRYELTTAGRLWAEETIK